MSRHIHRDLPLVLVGSYVLGYFAGQSFALVWVSGAASKHGVDRLTSGVGELVARRGHGPHQPAAEAA